MTGSSDGEGEMLGEILVEARTIKDYCWDR